MAKPAAAFLGEPGAYRYKACAQYFGAEIAAVPQPSFRALFEILTIFSNNSFNLVKQLLHLKFYGSTKYNAGLNRLLFKRIFGLNTYLPQTIFL